MRVFVVTWWNLNGNIETNEALGAFSNREKAQSYIDKISGHPANNEYNINSFVLDDPLGEGQNEQRK